MFLKGTLGEYNRIFTGILTLGSPPGPYQIPSRTLRENIQKYVALIP
jgi:hypothetical protein